MGVSEAEDQRATVVTSKDHGDASMVMKKPAATSWWPKFLLREATVAPPGYNRWLFPPAALLIHLSIGQAYGYSVFNKPLTKLCHKGECENWSLVEVGWIFTMFFIFLGSSAALFGRRLEVLGPRFAGVVAALCWGGGFFIAAAGAKYHNLTLIYIGNGAIGGIGLGCGYISPVSSLMKWFPDRPGLATGLAIMGFGGGAIIGAPLAVKLMESYAVWQTFIIMGAIDLVAMLVGAFAYRVPPEGWKPEGWQPKSETAHAGYVDANTAVKTPQFWLLWVVLCMNVSCGIGVLGQASPMVQDIYHVTAAAAAGIVGLFSLFNIFGRFFWSSLSDYTGRFNIYNIFFILGIVLYGLSPSAAHAKNFPAFFSCFAVIYSMYGGGFAAIPAYLRDLFGVKQAGAIHGRLLTAWSCAAVVGPYMLNRIRQEEVHKGHPLSQAYDKTLYILCGLLGIGLLANLLVPVCNKYFPIKHTFDVPVEVRAADPEAAVVPSEEDKETEEEVSTAGTVGAASRNTVMINEASTTGVHSSSKVESKTVAAIALFWSIPLTGLGWGLYMIIAKSIKAF